MNFTLEIKKEIVFKKMNKEQAKAFVNGILFSHQNQEKIIKVKLLNKEILDQVLYLIEKTQYPYEVVQNTIYIEKEKLDFVNPKNVTYYFSGIFLSSGSISNLQSSSYHLEIWFKNEDNCNQILEFAKKHISFNKIKNKNNYILYLKKNEAISDFLQIIGAQKSYFNFIDSVIERDFKNQITRIFNLDVHNQNRLVDSNILFKENYQYILDKKLTNKFTESQLQFYEFKKNNEFLSLSQLAEKLKKTKSCLNHWLIKLRNVCEEN